MKLIMIQDTHSARFMLLYVNKGLAFPVDVRSLGMSSKQVLFTLNLNHPDYDMTPIERYNEAFSDIGGVLDEERLEELFFSALNIENCSTLGCYFVGRDDLYSFDEVLQEIINVRSVRYIEGTPCSSVKPLGHNPFYVVKSEKGYYNENINFKENNVYEAMRFTSINQAHQFTQDRAFSNGFEIEEIYHTTYQSTFYNGETNMGYGMTHK